MRMLPDDVIVRIVVSILSVAGFFVARYIYAHKKPERGPLICPLKFDCERVVHSRYSNIILGVPSEVIGMFYYAVSALAYLGLILMPVYATPLVLGILTLAALGACLFSVYLLYLQLFVLQEGCFWCLVSAGISILVFVLIVI